MGIVGSILGVRKLGNAWQQGQMVNFAKKTLDVTTDVETKKTWDFDALINKHFSKTSKERLLTCDSDLQKVCAVTVAKMDFGVVEGTRTLEQQQKYFSEGKSKLDGVNKKSKHQSSPSMAVDVVPTTDGKWDWSNKNKFIQLSALMFESAKELKEAGEIDNSLRWGGDWDMDGDRSDQTFDDLPHYELV